MGAPTPEPTDKAALRTSMRTFRRSLADVPTRSARIWHAVRSLDAVDAAGRVLAFASIHGEPDTALFITWARSAGKEVMVPEDGVDAAWPEVVIVPGLAFTAAGGRLGQGGGWYDRFLAAVDPRCVTVGVGFAEQVVDQLPIEAHDIALDWVVTDAGIAGGRHSEARRR
jgi:5-formyltetrahydrofolate cyclo-ligase